MKVLNTLQLLLKIKKCVTYKEIAVAAKIPQLKVLEVLAANKHLLKFNHKDQIIGTTEGELIFQELERAHKDEKIFSVVEINYGAEKAFSLVDKTGKLKHICKQYWNGGIGGSWESWEILFNDENLKEVRAAGFIERGEYKYKTLEEYWKE